MNRVIPAVIGCLVFGMVSIAAVPADSTLVNNEYFLESVRLVGLAQESFDQGDYDAATAYAEEALKYALMSDAYIARQIDLQEADQALVAAKERLDWATSIGAKTQFPGPYNQANTAYNDAVKARSGEKWKDAITAANKVGTIVGEIERLKAKDADTALAAAKTRLDWATSIGAKTQFPVPYTQGNTAYNDGVKAKTGKNWNDAIAGANKTVAAVVEIEKLYEAQKAKDADVSLVKAKERLDWATSVEAKTQFPEPYTRADTVYNDATKAQKAKNWTDTITGANKTIAAVAEIEKLMDAQKAKDTEVSLAEAKKRLDWATSVGAKTQFPEPYTRASTAYNDAVKAKNGKHWSEADAAVDKVLAAVTEIEKIYEAQKAKDADVSLAKAKERLDWATSVEAKTQFPEPYTRASTAYNDAVKAKNGKNWPEADAAVDKVLVAVAEIEKLYEVQKAKDADISLAKAKERLDWATSVGAKTQFPEPYTRADAAYNDTVKAQKAKNWNDTITEANKTIAAVAEIEKLMDAQKAKDTEVSLAEAKKRLDWATSFGAKTQFPEPYTRASTAYNDAVKAKNGK
ncbi:MAG: hypothetical protein LBK43_00975, partial [Treponema sp.]|nr:hypothetical protein [Treponema sp.]